MVGTDTGLLWPDRTTMLALHELSRPRNRLMTIDVDAEDLLWPSQLINAQARLRQRKDLAVPIAALAFMLSIVLGIIIGPIQLLLIATTLDYNWVTATYYPRALHFVLLGAGLVTFINVLALALSWKSQPRRTYLTMALAIATWLEIGAIWLLCYILSWQPHQLTLALVILTLLLVMMILLTSKQYVPQVRNTKRTKIALGVMIFLSIVEAGFSIAYLVESLEHADPERAMQMSIEQQQARIDGVPIMLSDFTYMLCSGNYQVIYLDEDKTSGLFECSVSGEVYSVEDPKQRNSTSVRGNATYLGTTRNKDVSLSFSTAHYLYRSLPKALEEDELALMLPANSEVELIDTITPQLFNYWQNHSDRNLYINIFYNPSLDGVTSTRDFVLMAAMNTMALVDQLPNGNTKHGPLDGKMFAYIFQTDKNLKALNELGSKPDAYSNEARDALKMYRHLTLRLQAGEEINYDSLRTRLENSFIDPNMSAE